MHYRFFALHVHYLDKLQTAPFRSAFLYGHSWSAHRSFRMDVAAQEKVRGGVPQNIVVLLEKGSPHVTMRCNRADHLGKDNYIRMSTSSMYPSCH